MEAYPDLFMDVDCDQDQDSLISQKPLTSIESCDNMKPISNTDVSVSSAVFGPASSFDLENDEEFVASAELSKVTRIVRNWWSQYRIDYVIEEPSSVGDLGMMSMSARALVLHSRYWEAKEMVSFIVQTALWKDVQSNVQLSPHHEITPFVPVSSTENWLKKTTPFKLRGLSPSHRAQDAIVLADGPQTVSAKFGYGPLHLQSLDGEQVDIYILTTPPNGEWIFFDTLVADKQGKMEYVIPEGRLLSEGMYPVKFVVRSVII
jgi:hypothetical protein